VTTENIFFSKSELLKNNQKIVNIALHYKPEEYKEQAYSRSSAQHNSEIIQMESVSGPVAARS
jgi:hypothetical protein